MYLLRVQVSEMVFSDVIPSNLRSINDDESLLNQLSELNFSVSGYFRQLLLLCFGDHNHPVRSFSYTSRRIDQASCHIVNSLQDWMRIRA